MSNSANFVDVFRAQVSDALDNVRVCYINRFIYMYIYAYIQVVRCSLDCSVLQAVCCRQCVAMCGRVLRRFRRCLQSASVGCPREYACLLQFVAVWVAVCCSNFVDVFRAHVLDALLNVRVCCSLGCSVLWQFVNIFRASVPDVYVYMYVHTYIHMLLCNIHTTYTHICTCTHKYVYMYHICMYLCI